MKKYKDTYCYVTIEDDQAKDYKLSALLSEDGVYGMPSLEFTVGDKDEYWDHNSYLLNTLYPIVKDYVDKVPFDPSRIEDLEEITKDIPSIDFPVIYQMLERGIEMGFFNKTKKIEKEKESSQNSQG